MNQTHLQMLIHLLQQSTQNLSLLELYFLWRSFSVFLLVFHSSCLYSKKNTPHSSVWLRSALKFCSYLMRDSPCLTTTNQKAVLEAGEKPWCGSLQESTTVILCVVSVKTAQWHISFNMIKAHCHGTAAMTSPREQFNFIKFCSVQ